MADTCIRKRSDMTPCFVTDGESALDDYGRCVGCGIDPAKIPTPTPVPAASERMTAERLEEIRKWTCRCSCGQQKFEVLAAFDTQAEDLVRLAYSLDVARGQVNSKADTIQSLERELAEAKEMLAERDELMNEVRDRAANRAEAAEARAETARAEALEEAAQECKRSIVHSFSPNVSQYVIFPDVVDRIRALAGEP